MTSLQEEVRGWLELLVVKRRGLDEAVAEFSTRSPEAEYNAVAKELKLLGRPAQSLLIDALADSDAAIRVEALLALGRIGSPKAVTAITGGLHDPAGAVRLAAVQMLGELGAIDMIEPLVRLLHDDPDFQVREAVPAALVVLSHRFKVDVRSYLVVAETDSYPAVQNSARRALKILQGK
jgi:HEAT repeat protein